MNDENTNKKKEDMRFGKKNISEQKSEWREKRKKREDTDWSITPDP